MGATEIVLAVLLAPSSPAEAAMVEELVAQTERLRAEGDFAAASQALARAYAIDPNPQFLYGLAKLAREGDDCERAVELQRQFLASEPTERDVENAHAELRACGVEPEPEPRPDPRDRSQTRPDTGPAVAAPRPWYRDPAGGALLGVGAVVTVAGASTWIAASVMARNAHDQPTAVDYRDRIASAQTAERVGIGLAAAGAAVLVAAIVRYAAVATRSPSRRRTTSLFTVAF
jgi:hypothetical protein